MTPILLVTLAAWALVVVSAAAFRSRSYAIFRAVLLGVYSLIFLGVAPAWQETALWPVVFYLHGTVFLHSLMLIRPRLWPLLYRALVSVPQAFFAAGTLLALPWAVVAALGAEPWGFFVPYALALVGVLQSLRTREDEVDVVVADGQVVEGMQRHATGAPSSERPLRIVQITDPHLGPFMSVERLRRIAQRAVERDPDLVVLTGDFLTMESQGDPRLLGRALEPLRVLEGKTFACFGNHDHEAPETVKAALASAGVRLLLDDAAVVETPAGSVQILGLDFYWRQRKAQMAAACARHPRLDGVLRIVLLHDPGAFKHLEDGEADLVLSGHTHGGQVGLVSLGLPYTLLRVLMNAPDHGFWAQGRNRLYVHRGTGHYGFPLRLGVPGEESVLCVHAPSLRD